jgi:hypothetical protein
MTSRVTPEELDKRKAEPGKSDPTMPPLKFETGRIIPLKRCKLSLYLNKGGHMTCQY